MTKRFLNIANLIISKIEGGYYSPERHYSAAMGRSGETMFGIDRKWGGSINTTAAGQKFWSIIDKYSASWPHYYKGGSHENELKRLAAEMMYSLFQRHFKKYLSPKAQKLVMKSDRIIAHFYYACWNGEGRFKEFAEDFNKQVEKTTNIATLEKSCITARKNHSIQLIRIGGDKMERLIFPELSPRKKVGKIFLFTVLLGGAGFGGYKLYNYLKTKKE